MSRLLKTGLIAALVSFALGLGFLIAALALGATWAAFAEDMDAGGFNPLSALRAKDEKKGVQYYSAKDVDSLDIEFGKGRLELLRTDEDEIAVQIVSAPSRTITSEVRGGTLKISSKDSALRKNSTLRVYLPERTYFEKASLKLGAADALAEILEADRLEVELGAGIFQGDEIYSDKSTWEIGVGELDLEYLDCADVEIDCGMGCASVCMADSKEDYTFDISCGMGDVQIGDDHFSVGDHTLRSRDLDEGEDAEGKIDISCGMGTVDFTFDQEPDPDEDESETTYMNQSAE